MALTLLATINVIFSAENKNLLSRGEKDPYQSIRKRIQEIPQNQNILVNLYMNRL